MKRCLSCMELMDDKLTVCPHCGYDEETTDERFDQLMPGTLLKERFTIGKPLGRGGFGITYIAWDNSLQRKVAIKEYLPRGLASREPGNTTVSYDSETKEAFLRGVEKTVEESRKLAGFYDLESVVNVYDCFKENGTAYIVMELLKGETVKEKVKRVGSIPFDETLEIITPVLKALAAVHKTGIIHRDISPDNIFICDSGKVKLLDFGSARVAGNADERSRSIVLKHGYASKEQYTAKGKQGPFTDIYSVCATIYKMLTGITPIESLERINDVDELQNISELVKIPAPAAKAIMKGMSVNAADRIQSAEELLEKLNETEGNQLYDDLEETVTLYVPKQISVHESRVIPDEPVKSTEINPDNDLIEGIRLQEIMNSYYVEVSDSDNAKAPIQTPLTDQISEKQIYKEAKAVIKDNSNINQSKKETIIKRTTKTWGIMKPIIIGIICLVIFNVGAFTLAKVIRRKITSDEVKNTSLRTTSIAKYGVSFSTLKNGKINVDRSGYSASNEELLPAVSDNKEKYSLEIQQLFYLVNEERKENGLSELRFSETLSTVAGIRAEEIAWSGKYEHLRPNSEDFTSLFYDYGCESGFAGENISWNHNSIQNAFDAWMANKKNAENIMNKDFKVIGIGVSKDADPDKELVYCLMFYSEDIS